MGVGVGGVREGFGGTGKEDTVHWLLAWFGVHNLERKAKGEQRLVVSEVMI